MPFDLTKIDENFPFETFREGQREAIEFILKQFDSGKSIVILEAPTGSGKSPIGIGIAKFFAKSYYITVQKFLQSQIIKDFGDKGVVDLRGRSNYPCTFYQREGQKLVTRKLMAADKLKKLQDSPPSCNDGHCRKSLHKFKCEQCFVTKVIDNTGRAFGTLKQLPSGQHYSACPYYERLYECMNSDISLFNFSSFLFQTQYTQGRFLPRDLLIVDETHNLEPELLSFIEIEFNDKLLQEYSFMLKTFDNPEEYFIYFQEHDIYETIGTIIKAAIEQENTKLVDEYTNLLRKLLIFKEAMIAGEEWICEYKDYGDFNSVILKPIFVKNKVNDFVFNWGNKILLMSATILNVDVFCRSLGIDRTKVAAYRMKNRFPVANRPIYIHTYGKVTGGQAKQKEWGPKLLKANDEVIEKYPNEKGIVHTHNFNIARMIVTESKFKDRMLFQINFKDKDEMLKRHQDSKNSILVAPAMHEGLDLRGSLSRFQIIAKVPYPNFFDDKQLARRVELDESYLNWLVALKLVQSYGRSIRTDTDYADTYVLDEVFRKFVREQKTMLPTWFLAAIQDN